MHQVDAQIGEGSFAEVFSAEMTVTRAVGKVKGEKRKVALKIVKDAADLGIGPDCEVSYDDVLYAVRQEVNHQPHTRNPRHTQPQIRGAYTHPALPTPHANR